MKSVTIHQLDDQLVQMIEDEAKLRGTSMNKVMKSLLAQSLGVKPAPEGVHRDSFLGFCGVWSPEEHQGFTSRVADMGRADPDDQR